MCAYPRSQCFFCRDYELPEGGGLALFTSVAPALRMFMNQYELAKWLPGTGIPRLGASLHGVGAP